MTKFALALMASSVVLLASCSSDPTDKVIYYVDNHDGSSDEQKSQTMPDKFSMLDLGRALSKGTVDIYDPWSPSLTVPEPEFSVTDPLSTFPVHPFMLIRDRSVHVYSLFSDMLESESSFTNVLNEVDSSFTSAGAPPLPLIEMEQLEPQPLEPQL